jgi:hypothetical protein
MFLPSLTREVPPSRGQNLRPPRLRLPGKSVPPAVVDLQSGQIVRTLDRYRKDLPVLLASAECDCGSTSLGFAASAS